MKKLSKLALAIGLVTSVSSIALTAGTASARDFKFGIYSYSNGQTFTINNRQSYESQYSGDYKSDKNAATIRRFSGYYKRWTSLIARYYGQDAVDDMNNQFGEWYGNIKYSKKAIDNSPWVKGDPEIRNAWVNGYDGAGVNVLVSDDFVANYYYGQVLVHDSVTGNNKWRRYNPDMELNDDESIIQSSQYMNNPYKNLTHGEGVSLVIGGGKLEGSNTKFVGIAPEANVTNKQYGAPFDPSQFDIINRSNSGGTRTVNVAQMAARAAYRAVNPIRGTHERPLYVKSAGNRPDYTCKVGGRCRSTSLNILADSKLSAQTLLVGRVDKHGNNVSTKAGVTKNIYVVDEGSYTLRYTDDAHGGRTITRPLVGTSYSVPTVSAKAAIIKSKFRNLNGTQLANIIKNTADDLGAPGVDDVFGHGKVNLRRALSPVGSLR